MSLIWCAARLHPVCTVELLGVYDRLADSPFRLQGEDLTTRQLLMGR